MAAMGLSVDRHERSGPPTESASQRRGPRDRRRLQLLGTHVDAAEVVRWVGRIVGDEDPRFDRTATVLQGSTRPERHGARHS